MEHDAPVVSNTRLAALTKPITGNIENMTPAFTAIIKMGNLFAPLSGN